MAIDKINQRLRECLREIRSQAPHDELVTDGDIVSMLGLDSLDVGNFVVEIEHAFSMSMGVDALREHNTLMKLSAFIAKRSSWSGSDALADQSAAVAAGLLDDGEAVNGGDA